MANQVSPPPGPLSPALPKKRTHLSFVYIYARQLQRAVFYCYLYTGVYRAGLFLVALLSWRAAHVRASTGPRAYQPACLPARCSCSNVLPSGTANNEIECAADGVLFSLFSTAVLSPPRTPSLPTDFSRFRCHSRKLCNVCVLHVTRVPPHLRPQNTTTRAKAPPPSFHPSFLPHPSFPGIVEKNT